MPNKIKLFIFTFLLIGAVSIAQTNIDAPDGPPLPGAPNPPGLPIDGGLVILMAAGAYYGVKKSIK
ncbi:hypothetical protein BN863_200 [Formosa agariphila KMM 3901]|uniref:Uncharacterized protein n=1 Tax=Formosa agariphila (strain DSM 15362 / KCTC 12365 / LMG 23005 / KMM 3901 / M-2Alg 35-1) TaxID=1347342 RepID=T2KG76_FORAG|nr:hypothetical protein [Formosa agariphila]CDF77732.1 hypothetical protein BN863_200 [Formosa agariphila KMM 3901]